ncbi:MAG TPA: transcriptional repressor AgaR [Candidatus Koribacter sp.]|jgi:DeoR family transcriptional regulator of aga operon
MAVTTATKDWLTDERRQEILTIVQREGRALVIELAEQFATSAITIRKDLEFLQNRGLIQRTHGGALPVRANTLTDPSLQEKDKQHHREKLRIATAALRMVKEGQCVILDSGSTTTAIARALREFRELTVITNAVNIAAELAGTTIDVILTGGTLRKNSFSLVGPQAEDTLREINADILFLGVDGFDTKVGLTTPNVLEARVNRAMAHAARKVVAVCDASKFGRRSLAVIVPPDGIHEVITDKRVPRDTVTELREAGIEVTLV